VTSHSCTRRWTFATARGHRRALSNAALRFDRPLRGRSLRTISAREIPLLDFEVNALGHVNLLKRRASIRQAVFVFLSTNKVYGDAPNEIRLRSSRSGTTTRGRKIFAGVAETCRIDQTLHFVFGASKAAADPLSRRNMGATST